jgi:hypothetical protein
LANRKAPAKRGKANARMTTGSCATKIVLATEKNAKRSKASRPKATSAKNYSGCSRLGIFRYEAITSATGAVSHLANEAATTVTVKVNPNEAQS